jgi:N6-L-threonylcarbamoyladenine synthase
MDEEIQARRRLFAQGPPVSLDQVRAATPQATLDLVASFQRTVIEELLRRAMRAAEERPVASIIVSGGVAANSGLRARFQSLAQPVYFPTLALSTDNAAMIAAAAFPRLLRGERSGFDLRPQASLALERTAGA